MDWNYCKTCVTGWDGKGRIPCVALKESGAGCDWHNTPEHCKCTTETNQQSRRLVEENKMSTVTKEFRVDQYDNVYDADGVFYCNWGSLTKDQKKEVRKNPFSAK